MLLCRRRRGRVRGASECDARRPGFDAGELDHPYTWLEVGLLVVEVRRLPSLLLF